MNLTISLAQMHIQTGAPAANFDQAREWTAEAARRGSDLILLPELWSTGYDLVNGQQHAQSNRALLPQIAGLAAEQRIAIGGSLLLEEDGRLYNTFVFQSAEAAKPVMYSKIHLFRLMEEDRWLAPGDRLQQAGQAWGDAGLAVCYDLRFPEMFRKYAVAGARLFLICAEWPAIRAAHWQTLLRARSIENQCFTAAVNCAGTTAGEVFGGRSAVISPLGETLVEGSSNLEELLTAVVDLKQSDEARKNIPIFDGRRPDIYG